LVILKSFFKKHFVSEYKSGFLYIFSSKILIAVVAFLTTPVIARIYNPEDYGLFALMNSVALTISLLSNLTLPVCLLMIKEEKITKSVNGIIGYSIFANAFFFGIGLMISTQFGDLNFFTDFPLPLNIVILVSVSSFLLTITQILANLNIREKAFKTNVFVNVMDNFSIRASSVSLGFLGFTKFGLFFSDLTGKCINILTQLYFRKFDHKAIGRLNLLSLNNIWGTVRENKEYPIYNLPVSLLGNFSNQIVLWLLTLFFSGQTVGYFTMSLGLLSIPLVLLSYSFQPLITKKLSEESTGIRSSFIWRLSVNIFLLSSSIYFLIYWLTPDFVNLYLGEKWEGTISIIQILCIPFALQLLGGSLNGVFIVFSKQRANFVIKFVFLTILIFGLYYQASTYPDLKQIVMLYAAIITSEELVKILYIGLLLRNVRSS
jgi:O-antigen/teichoic acid export membrane protein